MKYTCDLLFDLISRWEEEKLTQEEIINRLTKLIEKDINNKELRYDINDCLYWKGYSYQFETIKEERKVFEKEEYDNLTLNLSKSKSSKTREFIIYLANMNDTRLTLNSLHFIKVSKLIELSAIDLSNPYFDKYKNDNLYNLYMSFFRIEGMKEKEAKDRIEEILEQMGMNYISVPYMQFRMHMEYLLSTISNNKKIANGYIKANSIKVAFSICPKEYLFVHGKKYYSDDIHKTLVKYLSLIDKNEMKRIKELYKDEADIIDNDNGYKLLFNML